MTRWALCAAVALLCGVLGTCWPAAADTFDCTQSTDLQNTGVTCELQPDAEGPGTISTEDDGHTYVWNPHCEEGRICDTPMPCTEADATGASFDGFLYEVVRDGEVVAIVCVSDARAESLGVVTPGLVMREFKRLSWPTSELTIQPPEGETLVHFDTNFYTTNSEPVVQTVRLVGRRVQIRATPTSYIWHFGDGETAVTDTPGAPHPDLLVTHRYAEKGAVSPSVDTTYSGEFRMGNGEWQEISETLTVPGETVTLDVLTARPLLVG